MKVLVCGGAGYIGSHAVMELLAQGYEAVVFDNLEKGHRLAVPEGVPLIVGDLRHAEDIDKAFAAHQIDAVIDFAAYSIVGESMSEPLKYFENNFGGTLNLLRAMDKHNVRYIVFSSTAAAYGEPENSPIQESAPTIPTNPYGESKLCVEKMLKWVEQAYGVHYAVLRYFNVAGAHISGTIGEDHNPESHLIPIVLEAAQGKRNAVSIYGDDYPTPDGTCIRDYIHVTDLADAHILALKYIMKNNCAVTYNLGNGQGFSVKEIVEVARKVTGVDIKTEVAPRRPGDPSILVASSQRIMAELGWTPRYHQLEKIIETAWVWHKNHPNGYGDRE